MPVAVYSFDNRESWFALFVSVVAVAVLFSVVRVCA